MKGSISPKRLYALIRPDLGPVLCSALLSLGSVLLSLRLPVLVGEAIDLLLPGGTDLAAVRSLLLACGAFAAVSALLQWLSSLLSDRVAFRAARRIRDEAFLHLQTRPLSYLDTVKTGDLVSRLTADADAFSDGLLLGTSQFVSGAVTIAGTLLCMWERSPAITLLVVLLTPVSFLVARSIAKNTHDLFLAQTGSKGAESAFLDETLSGQKTVKGLGQEEERIRIFDRLDDELTVNGRKATFTSSLTNPATRFVNALIYAAVAFAGSLLCLKGENALTVGSLSALLSYASSYGKPFNEISAVLTELQNAMVCAGRLTELTDRPGEEPDPDPSLPLPETGLLEADGVCFSYDKSRSLIEDLSFRALPGQKIAIVGPTGCGKTTVINLLMRFYDPDRGVISIGGVPTGQAARRDVRGSFGMVLQDTWLRTGTIRENIALGCPGATQQEIEEAARRAMADRFIRRLPQGYDTVVSDEVDGISAGQKQLLCLARVMLRTPGMLILDEATSSIDTRTELLIQEAFDRLMEGRTSVIVAHRLSTIRSADRILVMKDGKVIEQGTHEQLMEQNGFYHSLYASQFSLQ